MTAIATAQAGPWSSSATWTGGVKPGSGDTATINHAVTVSTSEIVGTSPASDTTAVLTVASAGSLTIQSTGTLVVRGAIVIQNTTLTVNGDGILEFDSSQATSPSTRHYRCSIGSANNQANSYFVANGTVGHPAIIRSNAGGGNGYFSDGGWSRGGKAKLTYADLTRIGDATRAQFSFDLNSNSTDQFFMDHCVSDGGAYPRQVAGLIDGTTFRLLHSTWRNSADNPLRVGSSDTFTGGVRSVTFCVFDQRPEFIPPLHFTIDDNVFYRIPDFSSGIWASFARNLVRHEDSEVFVSLADCTDNYHLYDSDTINPHFVAPDGTVAGHNFDGLIFELGGASSDQGDCILLPQADAAAHYPIAHTIVLPGDGDQQSGTIASALGNANVSFDVDRCTYFSSGGSPGISVGETYTGYAGMMTGLTNSICWDSSARTGRFIVNQDTPPGVSDIVAAANCHNNGKWNLEAGSEGGGYDTPMTGTPGTDDVTGDPQFVDSTRRTTTWDASLGGPGTRANMLTELMKLNDRTGYNAAYSVTALIEYVRAGFVPTNPDYVTGADDGTAIGAVQPPPGTEVLPDVGAITLTGFAPAPTTTNNRTVTPAVGALTIAGFAPAISLGTVLAPSVGTLTVTGFAPNVVATANRVAMPSVGVVTITGFAPLVSVGTTVSSGAGVLTLTGFAPTITATANHVAAAGLGTLTIAGFVPTVFASDRKAVAPGAGALVAIGFAPTVVSASPAVLTATTIRFLPDRIVRAVFKNISPRATFVTPPSEE